MYFRCYRLSETWLDNSLTTFETSFESQHVKGTQTVVKYAWEHPYHIFSSLKGEIIREVSPLLKFEISGVVVNTLTADDKHPVRDSRNLQFPIQFQLC